MTLRAAPEALADRFRDTVPASATAPPVMVAIEIPDATGQTVTIHRIALPNSVAFAEQAAELEWDKMAPAAIVRALKMIGAKLCDYKDETGRIFPAEQMFLIDRRTGHRVELWRKHRWNGFLHDPDGHTPALQRMDDNGVVVQATSYIANTPRYHLDAAGLTALNTRRNERIRQRENALPRTLERFTIEDARLSVPADVQEQFTAAPPPP